MKIFLCKTKSPIEVWEQIFDYYIYELNIGSRKTFLPKIFEFLFWLRQFSALRCNLNLRIKPKWNDELVAKEEKYSKQVKKVKYDWYERWQRILRGDIDIEDLHPVF